MLAATLFTAPVAAEPPLPTQTYSLENGLHVFVHVDESAPVAAVALATHGGSSRETPGRTGFAHMFEHLFFLDSENLGPGGLDKLPARIGGSGGSKAGKRTSGGLNRVGRCAIRFASAHF